MEKNHLGNFGRWQSRMILTILAERIIMNISVIFFFNLDQCSGGDAILRYFFFRVLATILFGGLDLSD